MIQKLRFPVLALLFLLAVHLIPVYRLSVAGQTLEGCYSPAQLRAGFTAAEATAEELGLDAAGLPAVRRSLRLRLSPAEGDPAALSDAILCAVPDVRVSVGVEVNGNYLGSVADGRALLEQLRESIRGEMPEAAAVGSLAGKLSLRTVYSRTDSELDNQDMIRRITGMAPVFFLDGSGRLL